MSTMIVATRRLAWLMLIAVLGGAAFAWLRDRRGPQIGEPPEWPPLEPDTPAQPASDEPHEATAWAEPTADGACPEGYPVKVNTNSGIFHVPGGRFYERTKPHRCYATADAALADGYRQSKS